MGDPDKPVTLDVVTKVELDTFKQEIVFHAAVVELPPGSKVLPHKVTTKIPMRLKLG